jgi:hypothetical protein
MDSGNAGLWQQLGFEDIERKDYGLLKTKRTDLSYRLFVGFLNLLATPFLLISHYIIIFLYPCFRDTCISCCWRFLFTEKGLGTLFESFLFYDKDFPPEPRSIGNIKSTKESIQWIRAQDLTYKDKKNQELKLNKLVEDGMSANLTSPLLLFSSCLS